MTLNQGMTVGAIGLAVFAVWAYFRPHTKTAISSQPAQQQRDAGLNLWNSTLTTQQAEIVDNAWGHYATSLQSMGVL